MSIPTRLLKRFDYFDSSKEAPLTCRCGCFAPGEIIEYYRHFHILGCMRCGNHLALVTHPTPAAEGIEALPRWKQAA